VKVISFSEVFSNMDCCRLNDCDVFLGCDGPNTSMMLCAVIVIAGRAAVLVVVIRCSTVLVEVDTIVMVFCGAGVACYQRQ